jgi:hypothetical protein
MQGENTGLVAPMFLLAKVWRTEFWFSEDQKYRRGKTQRSICIEGQAPLYSEAEMGQWIVL